MHFKIKKISQASMIRSKGLYYYRDLETNCVVAVNATKDVAETQWFKSKNQAKKWLRSC